MILDPDTLFTNPPLGERGDLVVEGANNFDLPRFNVYRTELGWAVDIECPTVQNLQGISAVGGTYLFQESAQKALSELYQHIAGELAAEAALEAAP